MKTSSISSDQERHRDTGAHILLRKHTRRLAMYLPPCGQLSPVHSRYTRTSRSNWKASGGVKIVPDQRPPRARMKGREWRSKAAAAIYIGIGLPINDQTKPQSDTMSSERKSKYRIPRAQYLYNVYFESYKGSMMNRIAVKQLESTRTWQVCSDELGRSDGRTDMG